jgi:hypothetical protein
MTTDNPFKDSPMISPSNIIIFKLTLTSLSPNLNQLTIKMVDTEKMIQQFKKVIPILPYSNNITLLIYPSNHIKLSNGDVIVKILNKNKIWIKFNNKHIQLDLYFIQQDVRLKDVSQC